MPLWGPGRAGVFLSLLKWQSAALRQTCWRAAGRASWVCVLAALEAQTISTRPTGARPTVLLSVTSHEMERGVL
jgi:hypothetical protein